MRHVKTFKSNDLISCHVVQTHREDFGNNIADVLKMWLSAWKDQQLNNIKLLLPLPDFHFGNSISELLKTKMLANPLEVDPSDCFKVGVDLFLKTNPDIDFCVERPYPVSGDEIPMNQPKPSEEEQTPPKDKDDIYAKFFNNVLENSQ
jgi:hypothetical protein